MDSYALGYKACKEDLNPKIIKLKKIEQRKHKQIKKLKSQLHAMQEVIDAVEKFAKDNDYADCGNPICADCNLIRVYEKYKSKKQGENNGN
jgi:hypothetical protein